MPRKKKIKPRLSKQKIEQLKQVEYIEQYGIKQYDLERFGRRIIKHTTDPERLKIASDHNTDRMVLVDLTNDSSNEIRAAVASNPNTPGKVLLDLMIDSNPYVRYVSTEIIKRITEEILIKNPSLTNTEVVRIIKEELYK